MAKKKQLPQTYKCDDCGKTYMFNQKAFVVMMKGDTLCNDCYRERFLFR